MHPGTAIIALWLFFVVSWLAGAVWTRPVAARAGMRNEVAYRFLLLVGAIFFAIPAHNYTGPLRLWSVSRNEAWACVAMIAIGFAFAWWARVHLGTLWSGPVTIRVDHSIIDTGPYAIVRHPIYTGIILAVIGTTIAKGTVPGVLGAVFILAGIWIKARLEERWLRDQLGAAAYDGYSRRVPMLVPFAPLRKS